MRAIVKERSSLGLCDLPPLEITCDDEVLIDVHAAGICRTDLHVARGLIPTRGPLILGHEFAGRVNAVGRRVRDLPVGSAVTVVPALPCGTCSTCPRNCARPIMLGVDRDGAFAEQVRVPRYAVLPLPDGMPFDQGAYTEPVAASLAVLDAGISPDQLGVIAGDNRIARLTERVLDARGFRPLVRYVPGAPPLEADRFDFAIETLPRTDVMSELIRLVRPGGKIVIKSRAVEPVGIDFSAAIRKTLSFHAVGYGSFEEALALLASGRLALDDLLGPSYPLEQFERAFAEAESACKVFLAPR
jgi:L-iditol 2-dehydrogenase